MKEKDGKGRRLDEERRQKERERGGVAGGEK